MGTISEIKLEDIDFDVVKECRDKKYILRYIKLLDEDGGYFKELLDACKDKLLELDPKEYYKLYPMPVSQDDMDSAINDLLEWEKNVKETDESLKAAKKKSGVIWDEYGVAPPVEAPIRGQEDKAPKTKSKARDNITDSKEKFPDKITDNGQVDKTAYARDKTRMKDYYGAWDKFDVEGAEEEVEQEMREEEERQKKHFEDMKEEQEAFRHTSAVGAAKDLPSNLPEAQKRYLADTEKEKGNEAFYSHDYDEAEAYYTRSIHFNPSDASIWSNRALVRLKTGKAREALKDCNKALEVNPKYMKAWHRKGKCLCELHDYEEAVVCFQKAMALSPGNTQINGDLMMARKKLKSYVPEPTHVRNPYTESGTIVEEIEEEEETKGNFTRVVIEEDSDSEVEIEEIVADKPPAGNFQRVQILEESDSEEEEVAAAAPASASTSKAGDTRSQNTSSNFQRVQILEDSDSEDEQIVETSQRKSPAASPAKGSPKAMDTGTCMMEQQSPISAGAKAPPNTPNPRVSGGSPKAQGGYTKYNMPEAAQQDTGITFDDMD
jgi:tetratricopeptide (TPR) repeat protein